MASALQNYVPGLQVEVVGNMVDGEIFHPSTGQPLPEKPFIFILIARLKANKGVDLLLHAFSQLKREKNALLYVAGGGPELDNLKQLASTLGIQDLVNFLGPVSHEQVGDLLRESHVLVSTSYIETFGVSLIEALACGKPVIATRSGGPSDIVHEKNGILFSPGDIAALSSALEQMTNTYSNYNPEMIRADCLARFGKEAIIQRLERIYCQVLK